MSVPYGSSHPAAPHTGPGGLNLGLVMPLVAAGLAVVIYALSFSDEGLGFGGDVILPLLLAGGLLNAAALLPGTPKTQFLAAVLTAIGTLLLLLAVVKGEGDTPAIVVVTLIASLLQLAASVVAFLVDAGMIHLRPRQPAYGAPGWAPPSGGFPQQGPYGQQYPQQPQYGTGPQQPQQYGQGQYGQPSGGQHSQPSGGQHSQPSAGGQHTQQPPFGQQPYGQGQYGSQQSQQHPGTPPSGFGSTGTS